MKKVLLFVISALLCFHAADAEISDIKSVKSDDKYSHWSIMLSGGFNMLITERMADWQEYKWEGRDFSGKGMSANYVDNFAFSGLFQADYMFTPQFGLRLQYLYAPINKKAIYAGGSYYDANGNIKFFSDKNGYSHQLTLQLEINMLNVFYRCRQNTQWGWYIGAGIGPMFYNIPKLYNNSPVPVYADKYRPIVTIPFNTSVEYSPISSLSVVFHAELDWYGDDELNGYDPDDQVNDMGLYVGLGLRYNICATKNPHVRLNDMCSYEPLTVGRAKKSNKFKTTDDDDDDDKGRQTDREDLEELQNKMDELEKRNRELQDKIDLMNREIMERLDKYFQDNASGSSDNDSSKTKSDKSGKSGNAGSGSNPKSSSSSTTSKSTTSPSNGISSSSRTTNVDAPNPPASNEPNSPEYRPTDKELKQQQIYLEAMQSNGTEANEVIFDLESSRVKAKFEIKVATVARRMLANKKLKLDIFAYLTKDDLTKSKVKLATDRLEAIYFILVNRYRIDPNRIKYDILEPSEDDEGFDIRCDMVYR